VLTRTKYNLYIKHNNAQYPEKVGSIKYYNSAKPITQKTRKVEIPKNCFN
jgi:hypothetical protein